MNRYRFVLPASVVVAVGWATVPPLIVSAQEHHGQMTARGAQAMGFDQTATTHHFYLYADGGAIEVTVNDRKDKTNLAAIRSHLPGISRMFAAGDFSTSHFNRSPDVPGVDGMARLRDRIAYAYDDIADGGRVRITTKHTRAILAVHAFLKFQIQDHKTGDSLELKRGQ